MERDVRLAQGGAKGLGPTWPRPGLHPLPAASALASQVAVPPGAFFKWRPGMLLVKATDERLAGWQLGGFMQYDSVRGLGDIRALVAAHPAPVVKAATAATDGSDGCNLASQAIRVVPPTPPPLLPTRTSH